MPVGIKYTFTTVLEHTIVIVSFFPALTVSQGRRFYQADTVQRVKLKGTQGQFITLTVINQYYHVTINSCFS